MNKLYFGAYVIFLYGINYFSLYNFNKITKYK